MAREERLEKGPPLNQANQNNDGEVRPANRRVLQLDKAMQLPKDEKDEKLAPYGGGAGIQTRYVEQWLNDVLSDAEELDMPGVLKRPEHKNPLSRYEIDKHTLTAGAVHEDMVDRIYRALFVHSVGFFGMIKEATKNVKEGKAAIQANIWRVFQVLLEYACKTDYKLVTQKIEESHLGKFDELNREI